MKTHLNLLPWELRRQTIARRILRRWAGVAVLATLLGGVSLNPLHRSLSQLEATQQNLVAQAAPLRVLQATSEKLLLQLQQAEQQRSLLDSLSPASQPLQWMAVVSRSAAASPGEIVVLSVDVSESPAGRQPLPSRGSTSPDSATPAVTATRRIGLNGFATDDVALSRFITALRDANVFASVELQTSSDIQLAAGPARQYSVECSF